METLGKAMANGLMSEEAKKRFEAFRCRPGDCIICTAAKSGTTLMQQVVQSLRTGGDMTFEDISMVIPFTEVAYDYGIEDVDAEQPGCIRAFKTHHPRPLPFMVDGCKCIYVARNPLHVATSFFHFFQGWMFDEGSIQVDDFVNFIALGVGRPKVPGEPPTPWEHILSCYPHRSDDDCLFLFYEDLVENKEDCVKLVAEFLGIELTPELHDTTMAQSDHKTMSLMPSKYEDHALKKRRNEAFGRPADAGIYSNASERAQGKVRPPGSSKEKLKDSTTVALLTKWEEIMMPETGCKTYEEFRAKVNSELKRPFVQV